MKIQLFLNKDINFNANYYYEKSKKLKSKLIGIDKILTKTKTQILSYKQVKEEKDLKNKQSFLILKNKKKNWYDKFKFTRTSNNLLFVFGKDAISNEILIKKHMQKQDLIFHTNEPKSPFGILKIEDNNYTQTDILECAQVLASFSNQWKKGYGTADVFYVNSNQVVKDALSKEKLDKGSFMIYGKKNILKNVKLQICFGIIEEKLNLEDQNTINYFSFFSGSQKACEKFCKRYVKLEPGSENYKQLNKQIKKRLKVLIEDLPRYVPAFSKILKN